MRPSNCFRLRSAEIAFHSSSFGTSRCAEPSGRQSCVLAAFARAKGAQVEQSSGGIALGAPLALWRVRRCDRSPQQRPSSALSLPDRRSFRRARGLPSHAHARELRRIVRMSFAYHSEHTFGFVRFRYHYRGERDRSVPPVRAFNCGRGLEGSPVNFFGA
jgi:hypothetical protein